MTLHGYWQIEAPITAEEQTADMELLGLIEIPKEITLRSATVWVHGREWHWETVETR